MRNLKIFLCIFFVFLLQTVVLGRIHFLGASISVVIPYMVCVMVMENEFRKAVTVSIICAAAAGALCGRGFEITVLYYVFASIIIFALRKKPAYISNMVKALFWTFIMSGVFEILCYVLRTLTFSADMLLSDALLTAVINTAIAAVVYPLLKLILYKEEKKKILIAT